MKSNRYRSHFLTDKEICYVFSERMAEMKLCYQPVIPGGSQYAWSTCR